MSHELDSWLGQSVKDHAIFMLDRQGHVLTWSSGAELMYGYRARDAVGRHHSIFYPDEDVAAGAPARAVTQATETGRHETTGWQVRCDATHFWAGVVLTTLYDQVGRVRGFAVVTHDMTERIRLEEALRESEARCGRALAERERLVDQLQRRTLRDPATGLPNRALLLERLGQALMRLERRRCSVTLLCLALERFEVVAHPSSRAVGDAVLSALARRIAAGLRVEDTVARGQRDELYVLCEQVVDASHAEALADRVFQAARSPFVFEDSEVVVTASVGMAVATDASIPAEELLAEASGRAYRSTGLDGARTQGRAGARV